MRILLSLSIIGFCIQSAFSQELGKFDLFGGYSLYHISYTTHHCWNTAATYHFNRWLGFSLDADGFYNSTSHTTFRGLTYKFSYSRYDFLIGPTISPMRSGRLKPFVHVLAGIGHSVQHSQYPKFTLVPGISTDPNYSIAETSHSVNKLSMATGGGIDIRISRHVLIRAIQADFTYKAASLVRSIQADFSYKGTSLVADQRPPTKGYRLSTGVVLRF